MKLFSNITNITNISKLKKNNHYDYGGFE